MITPQQQAYTDTLFHALMGTLITHDQKSGKIPEGGILMLTTLLDVLAFQTATHEYAVNHKLRRAPTDPSKFSKADFAQMMERASKWKEVYEKPLGEWLHSLPEFVAEVL